MAMKIERTEYGAQRLYGGMDVAEPTAPSNNRARRWTPEGRAATLDALRRGRESERAKGWPSLAKARAALANRATHMRSIVALRDGRMFGKFESITAFLRAAGLETSQTSLASKCLNGKRNSFHGFRLYDRADVDLWLTDMVMHNDVPAGYKRDARGRIMPEHRKRRKPSNP